MLKSTTVTMWGLPIEVTGTAVINHFGHLLVKEDKGFPRRHKLEN
jgi:hypothetical protein